MVDVKKSPFYLDEEEEKWVRETRNKLTREQKIGQLFCVMGGDYTEEELTDMVREGKVGGVLFRPEASEEIRKKYQALDEAAELCGER